MLKSLNYSNVSSSENTTVRLANSSCDLSVPDLSFEDVVRLVLLSAISTIGTIGNLLFVVSLAKERKLRTASNYLIGHLSLVDLLVCLIHLPYYMSMSSRLSTVEECWVWYSTLLLLPSVSLFTQFLIAVNRFVLITKSPADIRKWFGLKMCAVYIVAGWGIHFFTALSVGALHKPPRQTDAERCECHSFNDLSGNQRVSTLVLVILCVVYFSPAVVLYWRLVTYTRQNYSSLPAHKRTDFKTSRVLMALFVVSIACSLLSPVLGYLGLLLSRYPLVTKIFVYLASVVYFTGFCVNPFFYGYRIKAFRDTVVHMFRLHPKASVAPQTVTTGA